MGTCIKTVSFISNIFLSYPEVHPRFYGIKIVMNLNESLKTIHLWYLPDKNWNIYHLLEWGVVCKGSPSRLSFFQLKVNKRDFFVSRTDLPKPSHMFAFHGPYRTLRKNAAGECPSLYETNWQVAIVCNGTRKRFFFLNITLSVICFFLLSKKYDVWTRKPIENINS